MIHAEKNLARKGGSNSDRLSPHVSALLMAGALAAGAGVAQAQSSAPTSPPPTTAAPVDDSLTWHGVTLYGIVDIGLQHETHGAPFSDYHPAGSANIVQKNSRQSVTGLTPSNLSQSRVGLQGGLPINDDWSAVFKLETFFNPQSGNISDASKSMTQNNGRPAGQQTTNLDSSVAGQAFQSIYAGFSSKQYGAITFGRQTTLLADGVSKYDPNAASQAFSLIGMSGTYAGGGDTEDRRLDNAVKYVATFNKMVHAGLMYKFNGSNGASNTAYQAQIGGEYAGLSVDGYYAKANSAVSAAPLSGAQVDTLPAQYTLDKSLAGTISDNTAFSLMAVYAWQEFKFFGGYEHIKYANPKNPLPAGFDDIGGYKLAYVNNNAYAQDKILNVYWAGVKYTVVKGLDLVGAYYGYHQNSYATGANAGCSTNIAGSCSGHFTSFSFDAVYAVTRHLDGYVGAMWSEVYDGVANGYTFQRNNINPTIGIRFKF